MRTLIAFILLTATANAAVINYKAEREDVRAEYSSRRGHSAGGTTLTAMDYDMTFDTDSHLLTVDELVVYSLPGVWVDA